MVIVEKSFPRGGIPVAKETPVATKPEQVKQNNFLQNEKFE